MTIARLGFALVPGVAEEYREKVVARGNDILTRICDNAILKRNHLYILTALTAITIAGSYYAREADTKIYKQLLILEIPGVLYCAYFLYKKTHCFFMRNRPRNRA